MENDLELYLGVVMDSIPGQCAQQGFIFGSNDHALQHIDSIANYTVYLKVRGYITESEFLRIGKQLSKEVKSYCSMVTPIKNANKKEEEDNEE